MMKLLSKTSLRFRLNLFCMAVNVTVIICIAAGIGLVSNRMLRKKSLASLEQQTALASERLDALLDRIENATLHFVVNEAYKETYESQDSSDYYTSYLYSTTITSHLLEFLSAQEDIYSMTLFTYDGKRFSRAMNEGGRADPVSGQEELIQTFLSDGYNHHWYVVPAEGEPNHAWFVLNRKMFDLNGHLRGILSLTLTEKSITSLFPEELSQDAAYMLLFPGTNLDPVPLSGIPAVPDDSHLMVTRPYERLFAQTATLVEKTSVYHDSYVLVGVIILIGIGTTILSFQISRQATHYFLAPLELIMEKVSHLSAGDYSTRIHADFHDELGSLAMQIDEMAANTECLMEQIRNSEERKKQYEVAYLQMQLRPHFLYNTLENLCGMIAIGETSTAIDMIHDISLFYRAVLNRGNAILPLCAELEISKAYLNIMAKRYPSMFSWKIDVCEDVMDCLIPKLTLQPLLENSIIHGFAAFLDIASGCGEGEIQIICRSEGEMVELSVSDNGLGMTKSQLDSLAGKDFSENKISFGIPSIEERLRLNLGDSAKISIRSAPKKGTAICLRFPMKRDSSKLRKGNGYDVPFFDRR